MPTKGKKKEKKEVKGGKKNAGRQPRRRKPEETEMWPETERPNLLL